jgi:hypothetical protein
MDLRSKLLQKGSVPREVITVKLDEEDVKIEVRGLTMKARGFLMTNSMITVGEGDEAVEKADLAKIAPELVIECAYDPETGKQIFSEADREVLGGLAAAFLDPIITTASRLSGMTAADAKSAEGNSGKTTG